MAKQKINLRLRVIWGVIGRFDRRRRFSASAATLDWAWVTTAALHHQAVAVTPPSW